jgi:putative nucleotidyltransferase with HDIG domain
MTESIDNFKKRLADIREVSTLPRVMMRIMEIVTDDNSSAVDLADEIANDTPLTAKILKMVNSAYYGFYREIAEVSDAVVVLGFNEIRRLSLAISVLDLVGGKIEGHRVAFWNHSFSCAAMSDILARERHMAEQGAFTAGLLHDIGKSILDQYFNEMFTAIQDRMRENSLSFHEAEMELYGFNHADIGYWLAERWNLPVTLGEAIHYHHQPELATETPEMAQVVHLADKLSIEFINLKVGITPEGDNMAEEDDGFEPGEKTNLLLRLEERIGDSPLIDIFI